MSDDLDELDDGLGDGAIARLTNDVAVQDVDQPSYHHVIWWHRCAAVDRWVPAGLGAHETRGSVLSGDLTVTPSILCRGCGKHGFVEGLAWRDA
jgi:hypothetical protein